LTVRCHHRYDEDLKALLAAAPLASSAEAAKEVDGDVRLQYDSQEHYEELTSPFGMLLEWRDGIPRGAYQGVVSPLSVVGVGVCVCVCVGWWGKTFFLV
jgi:hypothetical protein